MSPFSESVSVIDTPFVSDFEYDYWETTNAFDTSRGNTYQSRMFIILAVVSMIIVVFSLFVLPRNLGASASKSSGTVAETQSDQPPANLEVNAIPESAAASGAISPIFTPEIQHWENKIIEWSATHALDPNIVATIMQIESCGDPQAVSIAGARGLFQVMPFHFSGNENMLDPDTNATRGLNFYNEQLRYTDNNLLLSFAGYNGGYAASGGAYENWPDETKRYYGWAKGIYEDAVSGATTSATLDAWLAAGGAAGCQRAAERLNIN